MNMAKILTAITLIIGIPFILLIIGFGIETTNTCPDHALVLVDEKSKEYYAPPCLIESGYDSVDEIEEFAQIVDMVVMTKGEAKKNKYSSNRDCADENGFIEEGRSLSGSLLEKIGILPKQNSRWNDDGTWKK